MGLSYWKKTFWLISGTGDRSVLNQVHVPLISHSTCSSREFYGNQVREDTMICAGYRIGTRDECKVSNKEIMISYVYLIYGAKSVLNQLILPSPSACHAKLRLCYEPKPSFPSRLIFLQSCDRTSSSKSHCGVK